MVELSRSELLRRMEEVHIDDADSRRLFDAVVAYLESGAVRSSNIGRHYAVADPGQREDFAEWFTDFSEDLFRFFEVTHEEEDDPGYEDEETDEGPDDEDE